MRGKGRRDFGSLFAILLLIFAFAAGLSACTSKDELTMDAEPLKQQEQPQQEKEIEYFSVTVDGGTIKGKSNLYGEYAVGTKITITADCIDGMYCEYFTASDGTRIDGDDINYVVMQNEVFTPHYKDVPFNIFIKRGTAVFVGAGLDVKSNDKWDYATFDKGAEVTVRAPEIADMKVINWYNSGENGGVIEGGSELKFVASRSVFLHPEYVGKISLTVGENCELDENYTEFVDKQVVENNTVYTVYQREKLKFRAVLASEQAVEYWLVNNAEISATGTEYTLSAYSFDMKLGVKICPKIYPITTDVGEHGYVQIQTNQAAAGQTVLFSVTPERGYMLDKNSLAINGESFSARRFSMPSGGATLSARFIPFIKGEADLLDIYDRQRFLIELMPTALSSFRLFETETEINLHFYYFSDMSLLDGAVRAISFGSYDKNCTVLEMSDDESASALAAHLRVNRQGRLVVFKGEEIFECLKGELYVVSSDVAGVCRDDDDGDLVLVENGDDFTIFMSRSKAMELNVAEYEGKKVTSVCKGAFSDCLPRRATTSA